MIWNSMRACLAQSYNAFLLPGNCQDFTDAGGHIEFYHPLRWRSLARINHRTHRELLLIDGEMGFIERYSSINQA
jgi:hypothetical protein